MFTSNEETYFFSHKTRDIIFEAFVSPIIGEGISTKKIQNNTLLISKNQKLKQQKQNKTIQQINK